MTSKQTSWIYRSLAWVTPGQAGWVFCGSALVTMFLIFLSIYIVNTNYTYSNLAMVMAFFTIIAGFFGLSAWSIDKYIKNEETRISTRYGLHFGVLFYLFLMSFSLLQSLH
jgi:hypothetical protein